MEKLQLVDRLVLFERARGESGLTHSQVQIWIGQSLHPASPLYNMAFAFVFEDAIDAGRFRAAWRHVARASALRTCVEHRGAGARVVQRPAAEDTELADLSGAPHPDRAFRSWARDRCARVLPLDGPLVDSVLVRLGERQWGWYLNQHHLVTDAWATVLLFQQVARAYASLGSATDAEPAIPPLEPYYETALALESFPDSRLRDDARRHWDERRTGGDRGIPLYGRPARVSSIRSERLALGLSDEDSRRVRAMAGEPGFLGLTPDISTFVLFSTVLSAWLHRASGRSAVGFDAPAHNRPTRAARRALGLFIEMFPFSVHVDAGDSFRALARKCLSEAQAFLRFALPAASSPSAATAGNVVLNYFSGAFGDFAGIRASSEWMHSGESDSVHVIRLQVHDYDGTGRYTLHFDFNEEAFPPLLRRRAIGHFERLLAALLDDPDQSISSVDVLTEDEHEALLLRFNDTGAQPLPSRTVVEAFEQQAARTPGRVAVRDGERELTFEQLSRDVWRAAGQLARSGVGTGDAVAILATRSIETVIASLAVLRTGAHYVPLDPKYPADRTRDVLDDSGAARVLVRDDVPPGLLPADCTVARVSDMLLEPAREPRLPGPRLDDLAYNIYTSGSTGRPKGVLVEHRGLADYIEWAARTYVRGDRLTYPLFTSLAFDLTVTSLYLPLVTGGTLVIYGEPDGQADTSLLEVIRENAVDFIKLTPSHLSLAAHLDLSASRIHRLVVGGEDFRTRLAAAVTAKFGHPVEIYNEYGPTEAVVGCMLHRYDESGDTAASVPIGRPADHVQSYVVNERLQLVPEGVPGELCISRHGLARGYHRRPEATARAFVAHPFRQGDRLYRTGDLVRFARPGALEYLGRIDRQVKVSGIRVEPGEIEAALLRHDAVRQCVVTARVRTAPALPPPSEPVSCRQCGLASTYPGIVFDDDGVCNTCRSFDDVRERARAYFGTMADLQALFAESAARRSGPYDAMMLLSGGKDSTYALCRLVGMGLKVHAFSFDNGYISEEAKGNIRRLVDALGVDHEFATTPAMGAIFRDSLTRFSNVCNGCFKVIYTLGISRAHALGIPVVVTGLSRGQLFETRLTTDLFASGRRSPDEVDAAVLAARKAYHRLDDQVSRSLDVSLFQDDRVFEEIRVVDFYRYCDADLSEMLSYLEEKVPWIRPSDTGRSTNCLINDVGIYIHLKERGHHNYALPYSWDVRMGHKTRGQALDELQDRLDMTRVRRILAEVGYDEDTQARVADTLSLEAYYVSSRDVTDEELRRHLVRLLPPQLVPQTFTRMDALPLTPNGKVDEAALQPVPRAQARRPPHDDGVAPDGPVEERIAAIWRDVLGVDDVSAHASLFELGGTSLGAMEIALRICDAFDVDLPLQTVFTHPFVAQLAQHVEALVVDEVAALSDEVAERLAAGPDAEP